MITRRWQNVLSHQSGQNCELQQALEKIFLKLAHSFIFFRLFLFVFEARERFKSHARMRIRNYKTTTKTNRCFCFVILMLSIDQRSYNIKIFPSKRENLSDEVFFGCFIVVVVVFVAVVVLLCSNGHTHTLFLNCCSKHLCGCCCLF